MMRLFRCWRYVAVLALTLPGNSEARVTVLAATCCDAMRWDGCDDGRRIARVPTVRGRTSRSQWDQAEQPGYNGVIRKYPWRQDGGHNTTNKEVIALKREMRLSWKTREPDYQANNQPPTGFRESSYCTVRTYYSSKVAGQILGLGGLAPQSLQGP